MKQIFVVILLIFSAIQSNAQVETYIGGTEHSIYQKNRPIDMRYNR